MRSGATPAQGMVPKPWLESLSVAEIDFLCLLLSTSTASCRRLALKEPNRAKVSPCFQQVHGTSFEPWPLPNHVDVLDNSKIHILKELEGAVHQCYAILILFPPCSPKLNTVEVFFVQLKRWIQKYANLVFPLYPDLALEVTIPVCTK